MFLSVRPFLILSLIQLSVIAEKYVFEYGMVTYKRLREDPVRNRTFTYVTAIDQHLFANAKDIKIRTNTLKMIEGAIKNLPHLKTVRLKNCGVESLAPKCFKNVPNLRHVHLQENQIGVIENGVFNFLPIQELWLQKNQIRTIRSGAFDNMPNLEFIKLNKNIISKWDSRWFANCPKLSQLFFRRNLITELPPAAFVNLKSNHKVGEEDLVDTRILLSHNQISYIHPETFRGLDALDELCLRKNKLEEIDRRVFAHMVELHKLNLTKNFLTRVNDNAFESLEEMLELDLSENFLKCLPFEIVKKVKKVDVSGNDEMDCGCLYGLREKLSEDGVKNEVVGAQCAYD